jgi:hypothetical protein
VKKSRWIGHDGTYSTGGEMRDKYDILVGSHEGKKLLKILGRRLDSNVKINLKVTGLRVWTGLSYSGGLL